MALTFDPTSLVLITAAVALAPIISAAVRVVLVPTVVAELVLGILIGPDVLNLAHDGPFVSFLAGLGMSFLFFLAGMELDLRRCAAGRCESRAMGWPCRSRSPPRLPARSR